MSTRSDNVALAAILTVGTLLCATFCHAQQSNDPFEPYFDPGAPMCMKIPALTESAKVIMLTPDQFQFARALYVEIPPVSHELPPGDHAIMATANGETMVATVDGDLTCARVMVPDFIRDLLLAVGRGDITHAGEGL